MILRMLSNGCGSGTFDEILCKPCLWQTEGLVFRAKGDTAKAVSWREALRVVA